MKKNILLYGVGTLKNKGVEAIISSTIKQIDSNFNIYMASHDYDFNKDYYNDKIKKHIKHYRKTDELNEKEKEQEKEYQHMPFDYHNFESLYQKQVIDQIDKSDICISVGGDNYCYPHCTWLYTLDQIAKKKNKKTVLWGASLFEKLDDEELISDLDNFDVLVIRESLSYKAVSKYISKDKIIFAPDPAFSLEKEKVKLSSFYDNSDILALNVSPLTIENDVQYQEIVDFINYILSNTKYKILLLPHVTTDDCNDLDILKKIKKNFFDEKKVYLEEGNYNCSELKYIISKCSILVAARTHASIAAYSQCIPTLVIGYSVKSKGIAKDLFGDYEKYVIPKADLKDGKLIERFKYIDDNKTKIIKSLKKIMPNIIKESSTLFSKVLEKLDIIEQKTICNRHDCIGCGVCFEKCLHNAITMKEDENGFIYPEINLDLCTHCNLCRKSCPINKENISSDYFGKICYAAKNKNDEERLASTSGGVFSSLAHYIIKNNGSVYGAYLDSNYHLEHIKVTNEKDLEKIRGSKYIQSNIYSIFTEIKTDLNDKKDVLFCGTPCQVGAIKSYLGKEYDNLLTVSVVCHGVMNESILKKYFDELLIEYNADKIDEFKFRTKEHNKWTVSSVKYKLDGLNVIKSFTEDALMSLYLNDLILRKSCYNCRYKGSNNQADLIIGDFWGVEVTLNDFFDQKGVSSILVNSKKGEDFLDKMKFKENMDVKKANFDDIVKYNPALISSVSYKAERPVILKELDSNSFKLVFADYKNNNDLEVLNDKLKTQIKIDNEKIDGLINENTELANKLNSIIESKRFKIINKSADLVNTILRRK